MIQHNAVRASPIIACLVMVAASGVSAQEYTLVDLGTLGGTYSRAHDISEGGAIAGYATTAPGVKHAALWNQTGIVDLGAPAGFIVSEAAAVNDSGQVAALDPLPGDVATDAFDVNDAGDVVGSSTWYTVRYLSASQATLWRDGGEEVIDLGYVPAPPWSCSAEPRWSKSIARAVNNRGQIVGEAMCVASGAPRAAFLWQNGVMYNLEDLIPGGSGWYLRSATGINDAGQIVGYGFTPNEEIHGFLLEPNLTGDVNGDGCVDFADILLILANWGNPGGAGDANRDNVVDFADLLVVLADWGTSCP